MSSPLMSFELLNYDSVLNDTPILMLASDLDSMASVAPSTSWNGIHCRLPDEGMSHGIDPPALYGQQPASPIDQRNRIASLDGCEPSSFEMAKQENTVSHTSHGTGREASLSTQSHAKLEQAAQESNLVSIKREETMSREEVKRTARKARQGYRAMCKEDEDDLEGQMKRKRFLERNRVAASKCRGKKKRWVDELESHARSLATTNKELVARASAFREELLRLKSECLRHTECDCKRIRQYLDRSIAETRPSALLGATYPANEAK